MSTMNDLKGLWEKNNLDSGTIKPIDTISLAHIVRIRTKKNLNIVMRYFWASFALQIMVYALLSHVIVRYGGDRQTLVAGLGGIMLFIPFTVVLLRKFKAMAVTRVREATSNASIHACVSKHYDLLSSFYQFKKNYELVLVPIAAAIGTFLTFKLYVPGGFYAYQSAAWVIFAITLITCVAAIKNENRKSFERPLSDLQKIREEFVNPE